VRNLRLVPAEQQEAHVLTSKIPVPQQLKRDSSTAWPNVPQERDEGKTFGHFAQNDDERSLGAN
jgi:hypothetical protein